MASGNCEAVREEHMWLFNYKCPRGYCLVMIMPSTINCMFEVSCNPFYFEKGPNPILHIKMLFLWLATLPSP